MIALGVGYQLTSFFVAWMLTSVVATVALGWLIRRYPPDEVEANPERRALDALGERR